MTPLDAVAPLLGALVLLAGIASSLVAMRFGAPLLLVFLIVGMLAGEAGPVGIEFDDVRTAYLVGSTAVALILFGGGLRTRFAAFRSVLAPALTLATAGVLIATGVIAAVARYVLGINWAEALLVGAVVASTDTAAVFFLIHTRGLRLRPRVGDTLEVEAGPFAVLLTLLLVEYLIIGDRSWQHVLLGLVEQAVVGTIVGILGARAIIAVLNRVGMAQGLHGPFVAIGALVIFSFAPVVHGSGFLAVYVAGLVMSDHPTRAHNVIIVFLDVVTWLAQIVMFVLLGLLISPVQLVQTIPLALAIAATLVFVARPMAVFTSLAPFHFHWREKAFISWVGLRGAVTVYLASIPMLVGMHAALMYFDIAFVVVFISILVQGWTVALAAGRLHIALPRSNRLPRRVELDLSGQPEQEIVGYPVLANSLYLERGLLPSWARPASVVRDGKILSPSEAEPMQVGDQVYLLISPDKAQALDRFFVNKSRMTGPDLRLDGDFFVAGNVKLGALADFYELSIAPAAADTFLADYIAKELRRAPRRSDIVPLGPITLVMHRVANSRVTSVGLRLGDDPAAPLTPVMRLKKRTRDLWARSVGFR
jgi:cell volume regulation protein A